LHITNFSVLEQQLEKVALLMRDATIGAARTTEGMAGVWKKSQKMEEMSARVRCEINSCSIFYLNVEELSARVRFIGNCSISIVEIQTIK
jgi:hypothetical protein